MPRRLTTEQFIEKARAVLGDRYDYSQVRYVNAHTNVAIICPDHGAFEQAPNSHLKGHGCRRCGTVVNKAKLTLGRSEFIRKANAVHGERYDYSHVDYVNTATKVTIGCPIHGAFEQVPNYHLSGNGCPDCGGSKQLTTETFIEKGKAVHGERYNYSHVDYVNTATKVAIDCPDHGTFEQAPNSHLAGHGCPDCSGNARRNTAKFIEEAREVHGDRYDYANAKYRNNRTAVTITCPQHGPFSQVPGHHLNGHGCPSCVGLKQLTTEVFIENSRAVHGERYDYSNVDYVNSRTAVIIGCPVHGTFEQTPNSHLAGHGCIDCGGRARRDTAKFIEEARKIHGERYDYSIVDYVNAKTKVTIVCPVHGTFEQTPRSHVAGHGCIDCAGLRRSTTAQFVDKAIAVHGERYDYSIIDYVNAYTKIAIICPKHGVFEQTPNSHLNGQGCPDCGGNIRRDTAQFIDEARAIHGDRYDYTQVEYRTNQVPVTIICPQHGPFLQVPKHHLNGHGCSGCADWGFKPADRAILYYLAIETDDGDTRYKIGITNRTVQERFTAKDLTRIRIIMVRGYRYGLDAAKAEAKILRQYAGDRYYGSGILRSGNTELFTHDILGLDEGYEDNESEPGARDD